MDYPELLFGNPAELLFGKPGELLFEKQIAYKY
jgi:hypothetical protein